MARRHVEERNIWNPNLATAMTPVLVPSSGHPPWPLSCCSQQSLKQSDECVRGEAGGSDSGVYKVL